MQLGHQQTHLGNVRTDEARAINSFIFDHTNNTADPSTAPTGTGQGNANEIAYGGYSMRLSGVDKERIGLARSLSVMPGDKLDIEVYAKYYDPGQANSPDLNALMSAVGGGGGGLNPLTIIDGGGYALAAGTVLPFINALTKSAPVDQAPKAYLNWAVFDRNYKQDLDRSGYKRITVNGPPPLLVFQLLD